MIEIINRQRKIKINVDELRKFVAAAAPTIKESDGKFFTVAFISDKKMRELNNEFRGKNSTTDVLSFPFADENFFENEKASDNDFAELETDPGEIVFEENEDFLGDIIISAEQAARQSRENNLDFESEIKQLILHGILHLCGFDHETDDGEMNRLELEYRRRLKINL